MNANATTPSSSSDDEDPLAGDGLEDMGDEDTGEDEEDDEEDDDERPPAIGSARRQSSTQRSSSKEQLESPPRKPVVLHNLARTRSPAQERRGALLSSLGTSFPRTYTVEAICALPHPVATHSLSASFCMTHLLTGSEDGYIRDYDIFSAVNGKVFLTAPQRHHCGVVEGIMKAGQIRCWWENPAPLPGVDGHVDEPALAPVYSMIMQSDALWMLAGSDAGIINLFTVRHDPGRLCHVMSGHRRPVSAMCMQHDEKGFFSASWDGEALQWDLNTGQVVRNFTAHGAQLAAIALKPLNPGYPGASQPVTYKSQTQPSQLPPEPDSSSLTQPISEAKDQGPVSQFGSKYTTETLQSNQSNPEPTFPSIPPSTQQDVDGKSDISFDPLFDDEDGEGEADENGSVPPKLDNLDTFMQSSNNPLAVPSPSAPPYTPRSAQSRSFLPPKNAPPLLDPPGYATFSPDILMTASIDGQVILWDRRVSSSGGTSRGGVGRLWMSDKTPPWCLSACWSADGGQVYAGRRNGTVDVWDVRQIGVVNDTPKLLKTLRNPISGGAVSCVVAFPDSRHIACASTDNIRLWNVAEAGQMDSIGKARSGVQFKIIPGHHGGNISQMLVDPLARFLVSASSNRGWHGDSTRTVFVHDVKHIK